MRIQRPLRLERLEPRQLLVGRPMITEFMADNDDTLRDEQGAAEDWIELFNAGDAQVDLAGYHLSDDPRDLTKWTFPPVATSRLEPGEFRVVFASGKDQTDAAGPLHTNFRLSRDGEFLALVAPDGWTRIQHFSPLYPPQREDIAYGVQQNSSFSTLINSHTPGRLRLPTAADDARFGFSWTGGVEPFDDSDWQAVDLGVGYSRNQQGDPGENVARGAAASASGPLWSGFPAGHLTDGNRSTITHPAAPVAGFHFTIDLGREATLDRIQIVNRGDGCCPERLSNYRVTIHTQAAGPGGEPVWQAEVRTDGSNSGRGGVDVLGGELDPAGRFAGRYLTIARIDNGARDYWPQIAEVEVFAAAGYGDAIGTDLQTAMRGTHTSAYLRLPFQAEDIASYRELTLKLRYDDGFVAYLNGTEVARSNAPAGSTGAMSQAARSHAGGEWESFRIPVGVLREGDNLLAIHGLNVTAGDDSFLLLPELTARRVTVGDTGFLLQPTPGNFNGSVVAGFLPEVGFSRQRGFYDAPLSVELTSSAPGSTIIYTTDGSQPSVARGTQVPAIDAHTTPRVQVPIQTTTALRAVLVQPGYVASPVVTHTYLFLSDVLRQPARPPGMPASWDGTTADYEMDPDVVDDPAYRNEMRAALTSIPTLSIVTDFAHLWDPQTGIYIHSTQRGSDWERPVSIELIRSDAVPGFQVDAGLRMWGTGWAPHSASKKHAFQLKFKDAYGPSRLDYPLFPDAPIHEFDDIVLRAQGSRSWNDFRQPDIQQTQYLHDTWARDTAHAMGKLEGHATFVHLYLNGLYWGLYNPVERTNEVFGSAYLGGSTDEYDVISHRSGQAVEATAGDLKAWNEMMALAAAGLATPAAYQAIQQYLEIDDFIDYMLLQQYATNHDGPDQGGNNLRALRRRDATGRFTFHVWDMEYTLWNADEFRNLVDDVPDSPMYLLTRLRENPEFNLRYADHVQRHLFNQGALTPESTAARWEARAEEIEQAILGESARWGDARRTKPYTRDVEWTAERQRLLREYFPVRTDVLLQQLTDVGLYPQLAAPELNQHGGNVPPGFRLDVDAARGTVYYTVDGSDPRLKGGAISPQAVICQPRTTLVAPGAEARLWVPHDPSLADHWTQIDTPFADETWIRGNTPLGLDRAPRPAAEAVPLQHATANFSEARFSVQKTIDGDLSAGGWGFSQPVDFQGPIIRAATAVFETRQDVGFTAGTELTLTLTHNARNRHNLGRFRLSATTDSRDEFADGRDSSGDLTAHWIALQPESAESTEGATLTVLPDHSMLVSGGPNGKDTYTIRVVTPLQGITGFRLETLADPSLPGRAGPGRSTNGNAYLTEFAVAAAPAPLAHLWTEEQATSIAAAWQETATSAYVRIPFQLEPDAADFDRLLLRLQYSDGFVAYLNGSEVARRNLAGIPRYDAQADLDRDAARSLVAETIDISSAISQLRPGANLLAIQVLNHSAGLPQLLVSPELIGEQDPRLRVDGALRVKARTLADGQWSALTDAAFQVDPNLSLPGDFNFSGRVDPQDIALLVAQIRTGAGEARFDLDRDGRVDVRDRDVLITQILWTTYGDANLDGRFESGDLMQVMTAGKYEQELSADWAEGDWNGDGRFDSDDLVLAFQTGRFVAE